MLVINSSQTWVYPRVCGGTSAEAPETALTWGLSPRVRGNHAEPVRDASLSGSIPACAGEPPQYVCRGLLWGVYPRVCGGTLVHVCRLATIRGLSPRVRGNPAAHHRRLGCCGSIPACAGEPRSGLPRGGLRRVYPRVCGGTPANASANVEVMGLSPRVRGNLPHQAARDARDGSIPACAGEPVIRVGRGDPFRVYPRVCGGTLKVDGTYTPAVGLSPRVRGNLPSASRRVRSRGSIPACAGEPRRRSCLTPAPGVYPRVCGGTRAVEAQPAGYEGLSPRVRGNLEFHRDRRVSVGSIPACAGEPGLLQLVDHYSRVYPRVCGGTDTPLPAMLVQSGLSPRVRGNRLVAVIVDGLLGSIPACAGEPPTE